MPKLAEAYVDIGANLKPMQAGLGRAKSMLTSFAAKGALLSLGAVGGAAGIAGGLLAAAKRSADLGESISKVRVVFGQSSKAMIGQADELARRFGVVKQSAARRRVRVRPHGPRGGHVARGLGQARVRDGPARFGYGVIP